MPQLISYLLFFLLFLLPFVVMPFGVSHYETPKVVVAEIGILLLIVFFLLRKEQLSIGHILRSESNKLTLLLLVLSVFHVFFLSSNVSFLGNAYRQQGTFLFWTLAGLALIAQKIQLSRIPQWVFVSLLLIHLYFAFSGALNLEGRSVGTVGEPNALAGAVIFLWPWVLVKVKGAKRQRVKMLRWVSVFAGVGVSALIILLSGSRSGMVALGLQIGFLLLSQFISLKNALILSLIILSGISVAPLLDKQTVYENRGEIWKTALIAGYELPLTGWGIGNTEVALKEYNLKLYNRLRGYYVDSSHNFLLDWWIQGGFIGLSLVVLLAVNALGGFVQAQDRLRLSLLLGVLAVMLFNPVSVVTLVHFWWLVGQGVSNKDNIL